MQVRTLYDQTLTSGDQVLPEELHQPYGGDLVFPDTPAHRPWVVGNFVQTLDGIVSLKIPGRSGGSEISGRNEEDAFIMGLLRSYADAVMIGEETFRVGRNHLWTGDFIYPKLKHQFHALRDKLRKGSPYPLTVIVSGKGTVDLTHPLFEQRDVRSLILTTKAGKEQLQRKCGTKMSAEVHVLPGDVVLDPADIAAVLHDRYGVRLLVHEGGPMLFAAFLEKDAVDELFLTIAPQVVGRGTRGERPNFSGQLSFHPDEAKWGTLLSAKVAPAGHLFLRYRWNPRLGK